MDIILKVHHPAKYSHPLKKSRFPKLFPLTWTLHAQKGFSLHFPVDFCQLYTVRACLHGGGGPQEGEVTRLGGVTRLSIQSLILM